MVFARKFGAAVAAVALAVSASAASAQNNSPWTGFYVGGHAGYGTAKDTDPSIKGFVGGIHGGYNWQFNQIVAGVEADYTFSGMKATESGTLITCGLLCVATPATLEARIDNLWSIRARLGFLATSNLMIYGTAGYGGFDASVKLSTTAGTVGEASAKANGLVAGGGLEYAFTRNILGRVEGLYYMGKGSGVASGTEQDVSVVRAGLSYKF